jgi:hypothetical protein
VVVRVAVRSTQAIRQGVKFSLPSDKDTPLDVAADTVLAKVSQEDPRLSLTHLHKPITHAAALH